MPDRTTKVVLTAVVSGFIQGMDQAARKTRELGTASEKLAAQGRGFDVLGRSLLAVGALAGAAVALAVKEFAEFDAKMSQVQALSHATAEDMDKLSTAALHMGQAIGFSANEVADAEIELVKAGIAVSDILSGALAGSLQLAAAGQIDVAQATEIATIAMTQFGLKGADIPHVADLLSAGADKALGGVADLGEALKSGGLVASQFGVSLEETAGTLSAFANAGLIGEVAGTDLRQMLLKLAAPAADAEKAMDDLGISIYDQSGAFVGITDLAGQLKDKLSKLTPEQRNATLATIFGARAIAGANVLYKEGSEGIAAWTSKVDDSGFAAKQAAAKMDNLKGDVSKLGAAFNTDLIESGSGANDVLRTLTQSLTGIVSVIGSLPEPVLAVGLGLTALVAVIGLVGGTALIAIPQYSRFKTALDDLEISGRRAAGGIGLASGALAVAGIALAYLSQRAAEAVAETEELQHTLDAASGATTQLTRTTIAQKLADAGAFDAAQKAGVSRLELVNAAIAGGDKLKEVQQRITEFSNSANPFDAIPAVSASQQIGKLNDELETSKRNLDAVNEVAGDTDGISDAAGAYKDAAAEAAQLQSNLTELIDTVNKANGVGQDAVSTNAAYRTALDASAQAVADFAAEHGIAASNLDESTAAGSKNAASLADLAKKSQDAAKAQFDLDNNAEQYQSTLEAGQQAIYDQAFALTGSADAAQALTDKIYGIPSVAEIQIIADTAEAQRRLDAINRSIAVFKSSGYGINISGYIRSLERSENGNLFSGGVKAFADGGFPTGIYAGRAGGIHKFAEENTGWEAYISGKPGMERRNRYIAETALHRLGGGSSGGGGGSDFSGLTSEIRSLSRAIMRQPTVVAIGDQVVASAVRSNDRSVKGSRG